VIKYGPEKGPFWKGLIPCLHLSENFKKFENLRGVKLKHLLEIQNILLFKSNLGVELQSSERLKKCS
jgi:hypothetical protein